MSLNDRSHSGIIFDFDIAENLFHFLSLISNDVSKTNCTILSVVMDIISSTGTYPTASEIQAFLEKSGIHLKRTQLYERLGRLQQSRFLAINEFEYPRRYLVNDLTLFKGIKNWITNRKREVFDNLSRLEQELEALDYIDPRNIANKMKEEISNHHL